MSPHLGIRAVGEMEWCMVNGSGVSTQPLVPISCQTQKKATETFTEKLSVMFVFNR